MASRLRLWAAFAATAALAVTLPGVAAAAAVHSTLPGVAGAAAVHKRTTAVRDGALVIAPARGIGLVLARPTGRWLRRICAAGTACGMPADPAVSPNGKEIAFSDGSSGRIEIATIDGACLWCLDSKPLSSVGGADPSFAPGSTALTVVRRGPPGVRGIWGIELSDGASQRLVPGSVTAAAWSQHGALAFARRGWVWVRWSDGDLRRVARGRSPAWSPNGREIALTRHGWVELVSVKRRRMRRIARGAEPVFSPDGRSLAYIRAGGRVVVRPLRHGRPRTLAGLRARSLSWQPVTAATGETCADANGAVVTSDGQATIRSALDRRHLHAGWNGCLTSLGIPFHIIGAYVGDGYDMMLVHAALAGPYAALQFTYQDKYDNFGETIDVYDLRTGALVRNAGIPCPGLPCSVTSLSASADGFAAWHGETTPRPPDSRITVIGCPPTGGFCIASDQAGDLLTSTSPAGDRSAWTLIEPTAAIPSTIGAISCPTPSLCVATDSGGIAWSANPAAGASATWTQVDLGQPGLGSISCPSASLCVATGVGQRTYTSTDPTGPAGAWVQQDIAAALPPSTSPVAEELGVISCASSSLCVIGDNQGHVLTSTDPAAPAPAWTSAQIAPGGVGSLACPADGMCAATASIGSELSLLVSTDPTGGASAWHSAGIGAYGVTCASTSLCVALDGGNVYASTDPTAPSPTWTAAALPAQPTVATCPTVSLCVAGAGPDVVASTDPTGGASAWTATMVDALPCYPATPCLAEQVQALDDGGLQTLDSAPQGAGTTLAGVQFSGDTVSWTDGGVARQATLR